MYRYKAPGLYRNAGSRPTYSVRQLKVEVLVHRYGLSPDCASQPVGRLIRRPSIAIFRHIRGLQRSDIIYLNIKICWRLIKLRAVMVNAKGASLGRQSSGAPRPSVTIDQTLSADKVYCRSSLRIRGLELSVSRSFKIFPRRYRFDLLCDLHTLSSFHRDMTNFDGYKKLAGAEYEIVKEYAEVTPEYGATIFRTLNEEKPLMALSRPSSRWMPGGQHA